MDLAPYVPQLITAVATLGGVVLTLLFTNMREEKHAAVEKARWEAQQSFERAKLLHTSVMEACADYLRSVYQLRNTMIGLHFIDATKHDPSALLTERGDRIDQFSLAIAHLQLLCPELSPSLHKVTEHLFKLDDEQKLNDSTWDAQKVALDEHLSTVTIRMNTLLLRDPQGPVPNSNKSQDQGQLQDAP